MEQNAVRILLVEDNTGDALLLNELLEESPFSWVVKTTDRLAAALSILKEENFDLMMMDLSLPDSSGEETLRRVLEMEPGMPVIVLSGSPPEKMQDAMIAAGARAFLQKGQIDPEKLWDVIRTAVGKE